MSVGDQVTAAPEAITMWARVAVPARHGAGWPSPKAQHGLGRQRGLGHDPDSGGRQCWHLTARPGQAGPPNDSTAAAPLVGAGTAAAAAAAPARPNPAAAVARPDHRRP